MTESEAIKNTLKIVKEWNEQDTHYEAPYLGEDDMETIEEALEMCDKINQEKQVILEDMREAIIDKLEEQLKDTRLASATGAFNECFFESQSYLQGVEDTYKKAIGIVKEVMKDGE